MRHVHKVAIGEPEENTPLAGIRRRRNDNIKANND
jgi:hypothetical protein